MMSKRGCVSGVRREATWSKRAFERAGNNCGVIGRSAIVWRAPWREEESGEDR